MIRKMGKSKPKYEKNILLAGDIESEIDATINIKVHSTLSVAISECIYLIVFIAYFLLVSKSVFFSSEERL